MKKRPRQILRGIDLLQALLSMRPDFIIRVVIEEKAFQLCVKMAIHMVRSLSCEGEFRNGKVRKMRAIDHRRSNAHDHTFRDGRACLQFVAVTRKTVCLWDNHHSKVRPIIP